MTATAKTSKSSPIVEAEIIEFAKAADDFRFELTLFRHCVDLGFAVEHGGTYRDPVTGKDRQFDLRARASSDSRNIHLAVECKNTRQPVLVNCLPRRDCESYHHSLRLRTTSIKPIHFPNSNKLYPTGEMAGKSYTMLCRDNSGNVIGSSDLYEKWNQATASATDLVANFVAHGSCATPYNSHTVFLPCLVVPDNLLWAVDFSDQGELLAEARRIDSVSFYIGKTIQPNPEFTLSHLHLYTESGFRKFLGQISSNQKFWSQVFPMVAIIIESAGDQR